MGTKTVKEHYAEHLSSFYGWMMGDFETRVAEQLAFFTSQDISPRQQGLAIDLGAGTGIQTCALARLGFQVTAVDFDQQLLSELETHCQGLHVTARLMDMVSFMQHPGMVAELITCMGDTLTHLRDMDEVKQFLNDCVAALDSGGKLVLTFRNYTTALHGDDRFIPVKSDDSRILTCVLEYYPAHVFVTDVLNEKTAEGWQQKVSSYTKLRIPPAEIVHYLEEVGMQVDVSDTIQRFYTIIAQKVK